MRTVLVVIGTRPEAIKLAPVVAALRARPQDFRTVVCLTGQHRELVDDLLEPLRLQVDHNLDVMLAGASVTDVARRVLERLPAVLKAESPDVVVVQGDTVSATVGGLAAFYAGIEVAHVEAGLRTGRLDEPFPEEGNRRLLAAIASVHFAPTSLSADNLRSENIAEHQIVVTGNTGIDSFRDVASRLPTDVPEPLRAIDHEGRQLVLVTVHRRENQTHHLLRICEAVRRVAEDPDAHIIFPMHPSPAVRKVLYEQLADHDRISLIEPLDYESMVWLLMRCRLVLTDSGGLQEEAAAAGRPVLVLRRNTDRPEGVRSGCAVLVGSDVEDIVRWTEQLLHDELSHASLAHATGVYGDGHAATRIADVLAEDLLVDADDLASAGTTAAPGLF
jgi:UDP-N-acetylglucosamine 2-epimerase